MKAKFGVLEQTHGLHAKFIIDRFILSPYGGENPNICRFWNSAFSVVASWQQSGEVEHWCTTTNLPLSNGIKVVSVVLTSLALASPHYCDWPATARSSLTTRRRLLKPTAESIAVSQ